MKKRIVPIILTALIFTMTGCKNGGTSSQLEVGNVDVCTAYSTEKVLRDKPYKNGGDTLTIKTFKNEYESAQIIMTPDYDVEEYAITLSDLTCGENVLKKENFQAFHQKYLYVDSDYEVLNDLGAGAYPEALLPMKTAIKYDENVIKSGENQCIWVSLKTPKTQAAGTYTGTFTVTIDGVNKAVPVEVTVWDYAISDENHVKSSYAVYVDPLRYGEANATQYMEKKYVDNLLEFRLNPQILPVGGTAHANYTMADIEIWLDSAVEYYMNPKCSYINVPVVKTTKVVDGQTITTYKEDIYKQTLHLIAERSVKENINLFDKMGMYLVSLDEAESQGPEFVAGLKYSIELLKRCQEEVAKELKASVLGGTWLPDEMYAENFALDVIEEMRTLKQLCTGDGNVYDDVEGGMDLGQPTTFVSVIQYLSNPDYIEYYENYLNEYNEYYGTDNAEMWLYTAVAPFSPLPNLHVDSDYFNQRALGWMMSQYNVSGHLYWYTNLYYDMQGWNSNMVPLQNAYETAERFPKVNGDGYLTYPGFPYGIDGPVNSTRLYTIRDSMEDYEALYLLEEEYKKVAKSEGREYDRDEFESFVATLTSDFYKNALIKTEDAMVDDFNVMREAINSALDMITKTGAMITDYQAGDSTTTITVSAPEGVAIVQNGSALSGVKNNNRQTYTITIDMKQADATSITATKNGETVTLAFGLGAKLRSVGSQELSSLVKVTNGNAVMAEADGVNSVYKVTLPSSAENESYVDLNLLSYQLYDATECFKLKLYNYGDTVTLQVKVSNEDSPSTFRTFKQDCAFERKDFTITLQPGWNTIELNVWGMVGKIDTGNYINGRYGNIHTLRLITDSENEIAFGFSELLLEV